MNSILIQSRLSSSRFPRKMLKDLGGYKLVEFVYNRCKNSKKADFCAVITSEDKSDDELVSFCKKKNIPVFRGSLEDVLDRYVKAAEFFESKTICRVCGDSPFVDTEAIDKMFDVFEKEDIEYIRTDNSLNGFMSEIFSLQTIKNINQKNLSKADREHVTKYIIEHLDEFKNRLLNIDKKPQELSCFTLTIDYEKDLEIAEKIVEKLEGFDFSSDDIVDRLRAYT